METGFGFTEPEQRALNTDILSKALADVMDNVLSSSRLILHCYSHPFLILKGQLSGRAKVYHLFFPLPRVFS